ncbi:MAG: hypothetical protein K6F61_02295 [Clostridiales bacterium]|nr:hypothetical protein [Clostridiales bacterium]
MEENNLPGADACYELDSRTPETALQKEPAARKGFPFFGIPAMVMLTLMLIVLGMEIFYATHQVSRAGRAEESVAIGLTSFEMLFHNAGFAGVLLNSLGFRITQLLVSGTLAAGLVALFYAMRNPRTVLTFACLWLIPACVPYLTMSLAIVQTAARTDRTGFLLYLFTTMLQTTSIFCFAGGLFTFLNLQKKGKAGGGPYYGLLIAVLILLLSALTTNALTPALINNRNNGRTVEYYAIQMINGAQYSQAAAGNVIKLLLQTAMAVIPAVVLCLLARKKSTKGKIPLATLWVFLAIPAGLTIMILLGNVFTASRESSAVFNTTGAVIIGGAFGGLIAYSFIYLMRRVPAVLFGLIAVVLAGTMSCVTTQDLTMSRLGLRETIWPQVILAAFDGRLVLIVTVLSFALRSHTESRPWAFVIAVPLLTGSMLWGEINVSYLFLSRTSNVSMQALRYMMSASAAVSEQAAAARAAAVQSVRTGSQLLLAIPAVLLGAGGAVLLRYSLDAPENPERG